MNPNSAGSPASQRSSAGGFCLARAIGAVCWGAWIAFFAITAGAATPGLPFTDDFADTNLNRAAQTTANWATSDEELRLAERHHGYGGFAFGTVISSNLSAATDATTSVALGDIDGDGDLDLLLGNEGQANELYLNNGDGSFALGSFSGNARATMWIGTADVDRDGDLDVITGNYNDNNRLLRNNGGSFSGENLNPAIHATRALAVADLDGDGDPDIVSGNEGEVNRVYLNDGNGLFGTSSDIGVDTHNSRSVTLGDMDFDGKLDLVVGNDGQPNRLYLGDGAGGFGLGSDITTDADATYAIVLGDVDGDGYLDVIAGNNGTADRLYLNDGAGGFVSGVDVAAGETLATDALSVSDIDGDGDLDLFAATQSGQANRLYLNNGTATPFNPVAATDVTADLLNTHGLAVGDLDGDGDGDLVAGNYGGETSRVYLNGLTANPFEIAGGVNHDTDLGYGISVALGDLDHDGDLDLVAGNYQQANRVYLNDGSGFGPGSDVSLDANETRSLALGDVNGDGHLDLLEGNGTSSSFGTNQVYVGIGNGTFAPATPLSTDADLTEALALGDVDGDGDLDVVAGNGWNRINHLYRNNGDGTFAAGSDIAIDARDTRAVALGDIDQDGDLDLVVGNSSGQTNQLYLNDGGGNFGPGSYISTNAHNTMSIVLADADGDWDLDLFTGNLGARNRLYLNSGNGNFSTEADIAVDTDLTFHIGVADVDRDGDLDLVAGNEFNQTNRLYLNNGTANPFPTTGSGIAMNSGAEQTLSLILGDLDNDGDIDLVTGNRSQNKQIYFNNAALPSPIPFIGVTGRDATADTGNTETLALGDVDQDGDLDLIAGNYNQINRLYLNNGQGTLTNGFDITTDAQNTREIALGDVNKDGYLDLVAGNNNEVNRLYLNDGNGILATGTNITAESQKTTSVALGDVDRDGDLDLIAGNYNQVNRLYLNAGSGSFSNGVDVTPDSHNTDDVALGDVDNDGDLDLIAGNYNEVNRLYLNDGTGTYSNGIGITADAHWTTCITLGDVDQDGDLDFIAGNGGEPNRLYINDGAGSFTNATDISSEALNTSGVLLTDIDQDGDLDLVTSENSSANRLYVNNGTDTPFAGVTGVEITPEVGSTFAVAAGDLNGNGDVELVMGNAFNELNRIYQRNVFDTARGQAASLRVDTEVSPITNATLTATATQPTNTDIDYFMSNDGGAQFFQVQSGRAFTFPTPGTNLQWRADLRSASPALSPRLDTIAIAASVSAGTNTLVVVTPYGTAVPPAGTNLLATGTSTNSMIIDSPIVNGGTQQVVAGWTGAGDVPASGATTNTGPFTLNQDSTITWNWKTQFWLDTQVSSSGSVDVASGWFEEGTNVTITATPGAAYHFVDWAGNIGGADPSNTVLSVTMDQARSVTANFAIDRFDLVIDSPYGAPNPVGTNTYDYGTLVSPSLSGSLEVLGTTQHVATGWTGTGDVIPGTGIFTSFFITTHSTLSWQWQTQFWLDTQTNGNGSVDVPDGWFNDGTNVTFSATPGAAYHFVDWAGDIGGGDPSNAVLSVTMDQARALTANFDANVYTITPTSGTNGVIYPSAPVMVNEGKDAFFFIKPNAGYEINDVLVDSVSVGPTSTYTFNSVSTNHSIDASFVILSLTNSVQITKESDAAGPLLPGQAVTYSIIPSNTTPDLHLGVVVQDTVPLHTTYAPASANAGGAEAAGIVSWDLGKNSAPLPGMVTLSDSGNRLTIPVLHDSWLDESNPLKTYGRESVLEVEGELTRRKRAVQKYDLSRIPTNSTVNSAKLVLQRVGGDSGEDDDLEIRSISEFWTHKSATWLIRDDPTPWTNPGGDFGGAYATATVPNGHIGPVKWDVTTLVQGWINGSIPNQGLLIKRATEDGNDRIRHLFAGDSFIPSAFRGFIELELASTSGVSTISTLDVDPVLVASSSLVTVTMTLAASSPISNVFPTAALEVSASTNILVNQVSGPTPPFATVDSLGVDFQYTYQVDAGLIPETISFRGGATSSNGFFADAVSPGIIVTPILSFQASLDDPLAPAATQIVNVASITSDQQPVVSTAIVIDSALPTLYITATASSNGIITPSGSIPITSGASTSFVITANANYHIEDVLTNGVSVGSFTYLDTAYTQQFVNVTNDITLSATFGIDTAGVLWFATIDDVPSPSGVTNVDTWSESQIIEVGDPGLAFGTNSAGIASIIFDLSPFAQDSSADIDAMHIVSRTTTVGSTTNSVTVQPGDLLFSCNQDETFSGLAVNQRDLAVFRPASLTNYTSGSFIFLLDNVGSEDLKDIALVEEDVTVGGVVLATGDLLLIKLITDTAGDIYHYQPGSVGEGSTSNATETMLIDASDIGITFTAPIRGIELMERATMIGGFILPHGSILTTLGANDSSVGTNGLNTTRHDLFYLDVTQAGATTLAGAYMAFEGGDIGLNTTFETPYAIGVGEPLVTFPLLTITASSGPGGSISPTGIVSVVFDGSTNFVITADADYHVSDILTNGASVGIFTQADTVYTQLFANVTSNQTIDASFAIDRFDLLVTSSFGAPTPAAGANTFNVGTLVTAELPNSPVINGATQQVVTGWSGTGDVPVSGVTTNTGSFPITQNSSITWNWQTQYQLNVATNGNGSVDLVSGWFDDGANLTVTATPGVGYHLENWTGDIGGADPTNTVLDLTMDRTRSVTANFAINTYTITPTTGANGTINPSASVIVDHGSGTSFVVTAAANYHIESVLTNAMPVGPFTQADTVYTQLFANVTSNQTIDASFAIDQFDLLVTSSFGAPTPAAGTNTFNVGTLVTAEIPNSPVINGATQQVVTGWSGTGDVPASGVTTNTGSFPITQNSSITWNWQTQYQLNVATNGNGSVDLVSGWFDDGTNLTVTATPGVGYHLENWTGDIGGADPTNTVLDLTMDRTRSVTANFAIDQFEFVVTSPFGVGSPAIGTNLYDFGTTNIASVAGSPAVFGTTQYVATGWIGTGDVPTTGSGTTTPSFLVSQNSTLDWQWQTQFWFEAEVIGSGSIDVANGWFDNGSNVVLTATPNLGYVFDQWSSDVPAGSETNNPLVVTMDQARTLTANFAFIPVPFQVTTTNDVVDGVVTSITALVSAPGPDSSISLREAILAANNTPNGGTPDIIPFNIPGAGPHTIQPTNALPAIVEAVIIDGYSQGGAVLNTATTNNNAVLKIELDGLLAGSSDGLILNPGSDGSTIRGLAVNRFGLDGIRLLSTSNRVEGCFIGTDITGILDRGNGDDGIDIRTAGNLIGGATPGSQNLLTGNGGEGVEIDTPAAVNNTVQGNFIGVDATGTNTFQNGSNGIWIGAASNWVGGAVAGAGNVISGNWDEGIEIEGPGATGNILQGNLIGTDASGARGLGNLDSGILVQDAAGTVIGGTNALARNVISDNGDRGILLNGGGTTLTLIQGNYIGTDRTGTNGLGNAFHGIDIGTLEEGASGAAAGNTVGGSAPGAPNLIAYNNWDGVRITYAGGSDNRITGNIIRDNGELGIDLGANGVNTNDLGDADTGPNGIQNYPMLAGAVNEAGTLVVTGSLNSATGTLYRIEFYTSANQDISGHGEAEAFLGTTNVLTDASGNVTFSPRFATNLLDGAYVTSIALDPAGNTSEFGTNAVVETALELAVSTPFGAATPPAGVNYFIGGGVSAYIQGSPVVNGTTQHVATGWTGTGDVVPGSGTNTSFTLTQDSSITWSWQTQFWLNTGVLGSGSVDVADGWYDATTNVTITATPGATYHFVDWTGNIGGADPSNAVLSVTMDQARSVTANFALNTYTITPSAGANGSISPSNIVIIAEGNSTSFVVTADANHHIANVLSNGSSVGSFTQADRVHTQLFSNVTSNQSIDASFTIDRFDLTVASPYGTPTPPVGVSTHDYGTMTNAVITGSPVLNGTTQYVATGWTGTGDVPATGAATATGPITLTQDSSITWSWQTQFWLNTGVLGSGSVDVADGWYDATTNVTITATPGATYHFVDWAGNIGGADPSNAVLSVTMDQARTVTANFALNTYTITPSAGVNGLISPSNIVIIAEGNSTSFVVTADANYHIANVLSNGSSVGSFTQADRVHTQLFSNVTSNQSIDASFTIDRFDLTVGSSYGTPTPPVGASTYDYGTMTNAVVTGSPVINGTTQYVATGWTGTGDVPATGFATDTGPITLTQDSSITWSWQTQFWLNTGVLGSGSVDVADGWYDATSNVTLTATPGATYHFVDWAGNIGGADPSNAVLSVTMDQARTVTANFALNTYTITPSAGANGLISPSNIVIIAEGNSTSFVVTADANYHIANVLSNGSSVGSFTQADTVHTQLFSNVTSNQSIDASFTIDRFDLTVGSSYGTPTPPVGASTHDYGTMTNAVITGSPVLNGTTQYVATGWTGTGDVPATGFATDTGPITITQDSSVTWQWQTQYWLDTATDLNGSVDVGDGWYIAGSNVTITATPDTSYLFDQWTGDVPSGSETNNPLTVTMDQARALTATFAAAPASLLVTKSASPSGVFTPGDLVTYTVRVTNSSAVTQTDVTVADLIPTGLTYVTNSARVTTYLLPVTNTYADAFNDVAYTGSVGTLFWTDPWEETAGSNPNCCDVYFDTDVDGVRGPYSLIFRRKTDLGIFRNADLSGYDELSLSFLSRRRNVPSGTWLDVQVSTNGSGGPWTVVSQVTGPASDAVYQTNTVDVLPYATTNTWLRFMSRGATMGDGSYFFIDDVAYTLSKPQPVTTTGAPPPVIVSGATLAPGQWMDVTLDALVDDPIDPSLRVLTNTTYVTSLEQPVAVYDRIANPVGSDLVLSKIADQSVIAVDSNVVFSITVTNLDSLAVDGVRVLDVLPVGLDFVSATATTGSYDEASGVWDLGTVPAYGNASLSLTAGATIAAAALTLTNTASIVAADRPDPVTTNNTSSAAVTVRPASDIQLLVADAPDPVRSGSNVVYSLTVTNSGPDAAALVSVIDVLPPGVSYLSATTGQGTFNHIAGTVSFNLGNVPVGGAANMTITARVDTYGIVTNQAFAQLTTSDPVPENNTAINETIAVTNFGLTVSSPYGTPNPAGITQQDWGSSINATLGGSPQTIGTTQYVAGGWTGAGDVPAGGSTTSVTFTVTQPSSITWTWEPLYRLDASNTPGGEADVVSGWFSPGTDLTIQAVPTNNYHFVNWTGDIGAADPSNPFLLLTMDQARAITANFAIDRFDLVVSSPFGAPTPPVGTNTYDYNTFIDAAMPNSPVVNGATQHVAGGWTGAGDVVPGTGTNTSFSITTNSTLSWQWQTQFRLDTQTNGNGSVDVSGGWFNDGTNVTITATPGPAYHFVNWTGDIGAADPSNAVLTVTMDQARTVTANFAINSYTIAPSGGSTDVNESGTTDSFTVVLDVAPDSNVVFLVSSADTGEATVDQSSLTFTAGTWSNAQTVVVTGVDDALIDGSQITLITLSIDDVNSDDDFDPLADQNVSVTTTDDDTAGFTIIESAGSTQVDESGTIDSFTVVLDAEPLSNVVVLVSSADTGEATVDQSSLTFTPATWSNAQTVVVTGVDDFLIDGSQLTLVTLSIDDANSDDDFDLLGDQNILATTTDNDVAGFTIVESGGSTDVDESGTTDSFTVVLDAEPLSNVVILVSSADTGEATVDQSSLIFTAGNWSNAQTVVVTGVDDFLIDGSQATLVTLSIDDANSDDDFDPVANQSVSVTTTDDDAAGFTVVESSGSTQVDESGTTDSFTVVLDAEPLSNVVILVSSADTGEATVDQSSLTFTVGTWSNAQTVVVTGANDFLIDGSQLTLVTLSIDDANSDDDFDPLGDQIVFAITTDDDAAGFTIVESSGSTDVDESGTTDSFTVVLDAEPASDVVLLVSSADTGEATVDQSSLTFTAGNWSNAQTVVVTGIDDFLIDGSQITLVTLSIDDANSDDNFDPLADQTVSVTTTDDDAAGFTIVESSGSTDVDESGTTDSFTVVLDAEPASDVVILVSSADTGEATVDQSSLTFTSATWSNSQTVVVTGVDDFLIDGSQITLVTLSVDDANSDDDFDPVADQNVSTTTTDDDAAGFTIVESAGSTDVDESGTVDSFTVVLDAEPASDVVILVSSADTGEATVDQSSLTFTAGTWSNAQTVVVTGVNDFLIDGSQVTVVTLSIDDANSDDDFDALSDQTVSATTTDDDAAGFTIVESAGSTQVDESGTSDSYTVVLDAEPLSNVVVLVSSADTGEVTVDQSSLTFTAATWSNAQTVVVTGIDDFLIDGSQLTLVTLSIDDVNSDDDFDPLGDQIVFAITTDDDAAGFTIVESGGSTDVDESGTTDSFTVVLDAEPASDVVILVSSADAGEATVDQSSLTFTAGTWSNVQTMVVTGVNDFVIDGSQITLVILSVDDANSDDDFDPVGDQNVSATTTDDDAAGFTIVESGGSTDIDESGTTDSFTVALDAEPASDVVILVSSADTGEATVDQSSLTFTAGTWSNAQTVVVTGVDDALIDGSQFTFVTLSVDDANSDDDFDPVADQNVSTTTTDDDAAGFTIVESAGSTQADESGATDSFTVVLDAEPLSDVVVLVSSADTGEATVDQSSLTFTPATWSNAQTVVVTGEDDVLIDGPQLTLITLSIDDANSDNDFDSLTDQNVSVTTVDNDAAGFTIVESTGSTDVNESGTTDSFTVVLDAEPLSNVVILVSSVDTGEATVDQSSLTFTPATWSNAQTVVVTGVDDFLIDGSQLTLVTLSIDDANSDDDFDPVADQNLSVTTADDDAAGFTVVESAGSTDVNESGTTDSFTVVLDAEPLSNVVVLVSSADTGEATVDQSSLTFTPANWSNAQTVVATGIDDFLIDGSQITLVTLSIDDANSDDDFDLLGDQNVSATTTDDDAAGFTIVESTGSTDVNESGTTDSFTVVLDAEPLSNVVVLVSSADTGEATVDQSSLTFTPATWSNAQTVVVTGVDDFLIDGSQLTLVTLGVDDANSDDDFDPVADQNVSTTTTDDDVAGFTVVESAGSTQVDESGTTDSFTVVLDAEPASDVVILVSSADTGEATVDQSSLTFTPATWSNAQTVVVTGEDDILIDGPQLTLITLSIDDANSDDDFDSLLDQSVLVLTVDDDTAGFSIVESAGSTDVEESGTADSFTVALDAEPLSNVVILVSSADTGEATVDQSSLTFTPASWSNAQTVVVTGEDDVLIDGPQLTLITLSIDDANSDDDFDPLADQNVSVTTEDNDVVMTVSSAYGNPIPPVGANTIATGAVLNAMVPDSPVTLGTTQYVSTGWTGTGDVPTTGATTNTGSFTLTQNSSITWTWKTQYRLDVQTDPDGVVFAPVGWRDAGDVFLLSALPNPGFHFAGWLGDVPIGHENDNLLMLTMDQARSLTAKFAIDSFLLTVSSAHGAPTPVGTTTHDYGTVTNAFVGGSPEVNGTTQYIATGWVGSGSVPSSGAGSTTGPFTITSDSSLAWQWQTQYRLDTQTTGNGSIDIAGGWFNEGTNLTITAIPDPGYQFTSWTGDIGIADPSNPLLSVTMDQTRSITANFAIQSYIITPLVTGNGSITPSTPVNVNPGAGTQFVVTADTDHHIADVRIDGSSVGSFGQGITTYTQVFASVTADHTIEAISAIDVIDLTLSMEPAGAVMGGAQWRLTSGPDVTWHASDDTISQIPAGNYAVVYAPVFGFLSPTQTAVAVSGLTSSTTVFYRLPKWALIPGGAYEMGIESGTGGHTVTVDSFLMSPGEVTVAQFQEFVDDTGGPMPTQPWTDPKLPVINVDWESAVEFMNWRSSQEGRTRAYTLVSESWVLNRESNGYRLPTEAEWEYAARGTMPDSLYPWGDTISPSDANYGIFHVFQTSVGGSYAPNAYGLFDMAGNAWEWVHDWHAATLPDNAENPEGPSTGTQRVIRGGSWVSFEASLKNATRNSTLPTSTFSDLGFRMVCTATTIDSDADGMPDEWEYDHFRHTTIAEPLEDPDGDGVNNLDEYRAGTGPWDANSYLRITMIREDANVPGIIVEWPSIAGRLYILEVLEELDQGFMPLASDILATPPVNGMIDVQSHIPRCFYRVRLKDSAPVH